MVHDVLATKLGMTQAWTTDGQRLCVTRLKASDMVIVGAHTTKSSKVLEFGIGQKKLKNVGKPMRSRYEKSGFSFAPRFVKGIAVSEEDAAELTVGGSSKSTDILHVGDKVAVQGTSKGHGFAGVVKRYGFAGGPKTHGQSDRHRAPGAIGNRTTPGRVFKQKRMAGHYGVDTITIDGLTVVHVDTANAEVWVSGPVPGSFGSLVKVHKTGGTSKVTLDLVASGLATQSESVQIETTKETESEAGVDATATDTDSKLEEKATEEKVTEPKEEASKAEDAAEFKAETAQSDEKVETVADEPAPAAGKKEDVVEEKKPDATA